MKNKKVLNKKISTEIGVGIIVLIAILVGGVFYLQSKKGTTQIAPEVKQPQLQNQKVITGQNNSQVNSQQTQAQPEMPKIKDEAGKSPEQIVQDFYEWYIGNTNYLIGQIHNQNTNPTNLGTLVKESPFVSSSYEQNIVKRKGMYDAILCTNDNEYNVVKKYGKSQIKNNSAEVDILRGYTRNDNIIKINIMLVKEKGQWKINDIICNFPKR